MGLPVGGHPPVPGVRPPLPVDRARSSFGTRCQSKATPDRATASRRTARTGEFRAVVHDGPPEGQPTLVATMKGGKAVRGKAAICPFCEHVHPKATPYPAAGRRARPGRASASPPTWTTVSGQTLPRADRTRSEPQPRPPSELLAGGGRLRAGHARPSRTSASLRATTTRSVLRSTARGPTATSATPDRRSASFGWRAIIAELGTELMTSMGSANGTPPRSPATRHRCSCGRSRDPREGPLCNPHRAPDQSTACHVNHIFTNEASIAFSYDYFETGLGDGPGTWDVSADDTVAVLRNQAGRSAGDPPTSAAARQSPCRMRDKSCVRRRHRPPIRQHDRLHGRLGPVLTSGSSAP